MLEAVECDLRLYGLGSWSSKVKGNKRIDGNRGWPAQSGIAGPLLPLVPSASHQALSSSSSSNFLKFCHYAIHDLLVSPLSYQIFKPQRHPLYGHLNRRHVRCLDAIKDSTFSSTPYNQYLYGHLCLTPSYVMHGYADGQADTRESPRRRKEGAGQDTTAFKRSYSAWPTYGGNTYADLCDQSSPNVNSAFAMLHPPDQATSTSQSTGHRSTGQYRMAAPHHRPNQDAGPLHYQAPLLWFSHSLKGSTASFNSSQYLCGRHRHGTRSPFRSRYGKGTTSDWNGAEALLSLFADDLTGPSKLTPAPVPNSFGHFLPICVLRVVRADLGVTARRWHAFSELLQYGGPLKGTVGSDSQSTTETMDMRARHNEHDQSRSYRHHHRYHHLPTCRIARCRLQVAGIHTFKISSPRIRGDNAGQKFKQSRFRKCPATCRTVDNRPFVSSFAPRSTQPGYISHFRPHPTSTQHTLRWFFANEGASLQGYTEDVEIELV
ncbi:hypothetical protein BKA70DRAFT_1413484 [Coprinopsis sp. MPI-PUGE-AT-0042]|nr:hypothetical protein BKA70DRAFT_1413484 [Coprinopsis sp. MPI-PUGE-AT-0042]